MRTAVGSTNVAMFSVAVGALSSNLITPVLLSIARMALSSPSFTFLFMVSCTLVTDASAAIVSKVRTKVSPRITRHSLATKPTPGAVLLLVKDLSGLSQGA